MRKRDAHRRSRSQTSRIFEMMARRRLSDDECFLCGARLTSANRSDEHVIPRWCQDRFELWDQRITLLNGTTIPYRQLTIPCCFRCNNSALQPLETAVAEATRLGSAAVRALDRVCLFSWLGKIFYGLLHRELFLLLNRRVPAEGTISTPELISRFRMHHLFLQNVRIPMEFHGGFPASMFIFETKEPSEPKARWDFRDNLPNLFLSVRLGRVGIVSVLQDGGAQEDLRTQLEAQWHGPLHPFQYIEVAAMVCYKALLATRTPKYLVVDGSPVRVVQAPLAGFSSKPLFEQWDATVFARGFAEFAQLPLERLVDTEGRVLTWLRNADGSYRDLSSDEWPW